MTRRLMLTLVIGLSMLISTDGNAASPWVGTIRGGGQLVLEGSGSGQVREARIHWNLKVDKEGVFNGHVSIMEVLNDGTKRSFQISKSDLQTVKTSLPPGSFFKCAERLVQVIGLTEREQIVVTFHENPNTIEYEITDRNKGESDEGYLVSATDSAELLDGRLTLECDPSVELPGEQIPADSQRTTEPQKIFLPVVSGVLEN
jgi:hypothetical protein